MTFWLHDLVQDLGYAFRQIAKNPGVTAVLVLTIALGIAVNTSTFGMVDGFLRPLPVSAPEQIVALAADIKGDEAGYSFRFSYPALQELRQQADQLSDVFAYNIGASGITIRGKTEQFLYGQVTGNYFSALGIRPALGRLFVPGEGENATAELSLVLGYSFWQRNFAGDPGVIGQQVRIDGQAATVIGVAPKEFHGLMIGLDSDGYMPLRSMTQSLFSDRTMRQLTAFGRMKPGASLKQVQKSMALIARRIEREHPATDKGIGIRVTPEPLSRPFPMPSLSEAVPLVRLFLLLLAALVLLLASMNVANVLMVRATVRQREMAIRAALGSGRGRLIRQMLTESLLLALVGGVAGVALSQWAANALAGSLSFTPDLPILVDSSLNWRIVGYSLAAAVFTGAFIGIWPALRASSAHPRAALHDGALSNSGGPQRQHLRSLVIAAQVAGSLVLLICAGLAVRSLRNAQRVDYGFAPDHVLNVRMDPTWAGYDTQRTKDFYRELERNVKAWPEVRSASLAYSVPFGMQSLGQSVFIEGRPPVPGEQPPTVPYNVVDSGYFETMGIPILSGRAFQESDTETTLRVAVVNQTMANRFWPHENPIGKRFRITSADSTPWQVAGVAGDGKYLAIFEEPLPYFYIPLAQDYQSTRVLQLRTLVPPESLKTRLEREVRALDPEMPINDLQTMTQALDSVFGFMIYRISAIQMGGMGLLGLVLALVGVYGVVSYGAAQRTREIGIRLALGATPREILRIILRQGLWMVLAGVATGLLGALALGRVLGSFLLLVSPTDPFSYLGVPALLAMVALWACYIPARRAMRVDPMDALRHE